MNTPTSQTPGTLLAAAWIIGFLAIGPLFFPLEWLFHVFPDKFPVIQHMRGVGVLPKALWTLCGPLGVVTIVLLLRRPLYGLLACILFSAIYVPAAMMLWGHFTWGCWAAIAVVFVAGFGVVVARRANNSFKPKPLRGSA